MRLKVVPSSVEFFQAFASPAPPSFVTSSSSSSSKKQETDRMVSLSFLSNSFVSKNLLKSQSLTKVPRGLTVRRSCSSNLDEIYNEEPLHSLNKNSVQSGSDQSEGRRKNKVHCAVSSKSPFAGLHGRDQDSFVHSRFDFLEPMMLGIKPDFPDRPDQETVMWAAIEQKAKSFDIPLSLRMIKKKLQCEEGTLDSKESGYCSVKAAFASMVFIVVELQSRALEMRETLCREDLEIIMGKVQKEMQSSFVWLFQQVFSRTPDLMLEVMILLADFSVYSVSHDFANREASLSRGTFYESAVGILSPEMRIPLPINSSVLITGNGVGGKIDEKTLIGDLASVYPGDQLGSTEDMDLWNSMVDEATKMREGIVDEVLDHESMQNFVSPVSVELEPDSYEDYLRTDLLYQMNLSQEPYNPLLLCNYAQFLHLVARDYDRAEECFKRAVQVLPPDAESLNQYASFLWTVRKDFWGAEERFLQALAAEPENSYYASRYANFLWSTGGEETCFPLNNSQNPNV